MDKKVLYFKIVIAQVGGFFISYFLVTNVFIGPVPIIRADFQQILAELPQKTVENTVKTIKELPEKVSKISIIAGQSSSASKTNNSDVPPPWIFGQGPSPLPTSAPLPGQPTAIPQEPTQVPQTPPGDPEPTSILRLPTFPDRQRITPIVQDPQQRPTSMPRPTSIPYPTDPVAQRTGSASLEQQTVDEINKRRRDVGLKDVTVNSNLTQAARRHSADMSKNRFCGHDGTDGSEPFGRMKAAGYTGQPYGETVACGARTAMQTVDMWWSSPPHHAILTNSGIREIGLGWVNTHQTAVVGM